MRRTYPIVLLVCLMAVAVWAATQTRITPVPDSNRGTFRTDGLRFWEQDAAERYHDQFGDFVVSGGTGGISNTLTHTISALNAYHLGYYVHQDAMPHTYTANRRTFVYADKDDTRTGQSPPVAEVTFTGGAGCTFQSRLTRFVFAECAPGSDEPIPSIPLLRLVSVDTNASAIVSEADLRFRSPWQERTGEISIKNFGAKCDGVTDDTEAINLAIANRALPYAPITMCPGRIAIDGTITVTRPVRIQGAGSQNTFLVGRSATLPMLVIADWMTDVTVTDLSLTRSVNAQSGADGIQALGGDGFAAHNNILLNNLFIQNQFNGLALGPCAFCRVERVTTEANNKHGVVINYGHNPNGGSVQWQIQTLLSELNGGAGVFGQNTGTGNGIGPFLTDATTYGNQDGGYVFVGDPAHPINDLWIRRGAASFNNSSGFYLETYGIGHIIESPWVEYSGLFSGPQGSRVANVQVTQTNSGDGLTLANNPPGLHILGGISMYNAENGVKTSSPQSAILNMSIHHNGMAQLGALRQSGVVVLSASNVMIQGVIFGPPGLQTSYLGYSGPVGQTPVGLNSYDTTLANASFIESGTATFGGVSGYLLMGHEIFTGNSPFRVRSSSSNPAQPKFFDLNGTHLRIVSSDFTRDLFDIDDGGIPAFPFVPSAGSGLKAACFDTAGTLFRSATGTCP